MSEEQEIKEYTDAIRAAIASTDKSERGEECNVNLAISAMRIVFVGLQMRSEELNDENE